MSVQKVFVTGAGGFIGRELCQHLEAGGHKVTGIDVSYPEGIQNSHTNLHVADYRDRQAIESLLAGHDVVVHLASAHLDVSISDEDYRSVNVHGLDDFLSLCADHGVRRFCHVSSVAVYGNLESWPATEETTCHPQSIYGETKLAGEAVVAARSSESGMETVILRPTWVYGGSCPRTRRLVRALRKRTFVMMGTGENVRHPIYIKDLLTALDLALERPIDSSDTLVVGGPEIVSTRELIDTLCEVLRLPRPLVRLPLRVGVVVAWLVEKGCLLFGVRPPLSRRTLEFFNTNNGFDISKARTRLGFQPQFTLRNGLLDYRSEFL